MCKPRPSDEEIEEMVRGVARAVELAPESAIGHMVQGAFELIFERDWQTAAASTRRALELDPGYSAAHEAWAWWLLAQRRNQEAVATIELVRELDPLSPRVQKNLGWFRYYSGRYAEAIEPCAKAIELDPSILAAAECLHRAYARLGRYADASRWLQRMLRELGAEQTTVEADGEIGYKKRTVRLLDELLARGYGLARPFDTATRHALAGDAEGAIAWLLKAEEIGDPELMLLWSTPDLAGLQSNPRLASLARRLGLVPSLHLADIQKFPKARSVNTSRTPKPSDS